MPDSFLPAFTDFTIATIEVMESTASTAAMTAGTIIPKVVNVPASSVPETPFSAAASMIGFTAASCVADAVPVTPLRTTSDTWNRKVPAVDRKVRPNSVTVRKVLAAFPVLLNAKKEQRVARRSKAVSIFPCPIREARSAVPVAVMPEAAACSGKRCTSAAPDAASCVAAAASAAKMLPLKTMLDTFVNVVMMFFLSFFT